MRRRVGDAGSTEEGGMGERYVCNKSWWGVDGGCSQDCHTSCSVAVIGADVHVLTIRTCSHSRELGEEKVGS